MTDKPKTELERLQALEWSGHAWSYDQGLSCCPVCDNEPELGEDHAPDCWLAARIAELKGEGPGSHPGWNNPGDATAVEALRRSAEFAAEMERLNAAMAALLRKRES